MAKVSVVIPAYNSIAYLPETVESVLKQTFTDFEVLIIDDGSSDQTVEWASQITDPRVKLMKQKNQGSSGARNTGIAHAQGEYVALLDADDIWEPTKLEKQVLRLEGNPAVGLVDTWAVLANEQGKPTGKVFGSPTEDDVWQRLVEFKTVCCCGSTSLIRRCCFETVGVFNQNLHFLEDLDMFIRIAAHYSFAVVKEPLIRYRQHPNNKSNNSQEVLEAFRTIIEKAFESAPFELLYLRGRGYGRINLHLAWTSINNSDYKAASQLHQQAIAHYSQLRYSWDSIRLSIAIALLRWFGSQGYSRVQSLTHALRWRKMVFGKTSTANC
jgi:glycosyltransferase involved in cell wall biosynthesis